jgi:hypothetical protein
MMGGAPRQFALTTSTRSFGKTRQSGQFALLSRRDFYSFSAPLPGLLNFSENNWVRAASSAQQWLEDTLNACTALGDGCAGLQAIIT